MKHALLSKNKLTFIEQSIGAQPSEVVFYAWEISNVMVISWITCTHKLLKARFILIMLRIFIKRNLIQDLKFIIGNSSNRASEMFFNFSLL